VGPIPLLVVAPSAYPLGGVATWLDGLMPGLASRGWSPRLAVPRGRTFRVEEYLERHPWAPTVVLDNPSGTGYGRRRAVARLLRQAPEEIVLVVNQPEVYAAALEERAAGRAAPRIVGTIHGLLPQLVEDFRRFAPAITAAAGTSRLACEALAELAGIERARIFHTPYGTEIGEAPDLGGTDANGPLEMVFAGRLDEDQKRVSELPRILDALGATPVDWRLWIAGGGSAEAPLREALGSDRRVTFLGDLPKERLVAEVFRPGRILLLTSLWETGPLVAWEAMASGMVLVTARFLGLRAEGALVDGENCRVFPPGDPHAAARCLAELAGAPGMRRTLARAGRRLVEARYTLAASLSGWDRCLRVALALEPPRSRPEPPAMPAAGRLDACLGAAAAEWLRSILRRPGGLVEPGDEWPHTLSRGASAETFYESLRCLEDRAATAGTGVDGVPAGAPESCEGPPAPRP
jgi:glycosyltransferase involved in cell wall biosynthesis